VHLVSLKCAGCGHTYDAIKGQMLGRIAELTTRRDEAVEFIEGCKEEQKDFDRVEFDLAFGVVKQS
jgi:GTP1/Obg family GTP-binding protein